MPWLLPFLGIAPEVWLVGFLLVAFTIASTAIGKSAGQSTGLASILTAPLRLVVDAWHKLFSSTISRYALAHLVPLTRWLSSLNELTFRAAHVVADLADETATSVERLRHTTIPHVVGAKVAPVAKATKTATTTAHKALGTATTTSTTLDRYRTRTAPKIAHATHAIDVTIPGQLGRIRTREGAITKDIEALRGRTKALEDGAVDTWKWIRAHPLSGVTGIFTGAVAIALARLGYGFLRCRSWRNLGRRMTCNDANVLGDLLLAATLVVGAMSLVELAREEQKVVGEAAKIIRGFWQA